MTAINTNTGAILARANMARVSEEFNTSMSRLSSGLRINAAKDDAAGMAISERMTSQIKGLNQAVRNAADGKNLVDTTEGAHVEISNMLQRLRELSVQSANDTNTSFDRRAISAEANQLVSEINRVASQTTWNGMSLLNGDFAGKQLQIGADKGQTLNFNVDSAAAKDIGAHRITTTGGVNLGDESGIESETLTLTGHLGSAEITTSAEQSAESLAKAINAEASKTGVEATAINKAKLSFGVAGSATFKLNGVSISASVNDTGDIRTLRDAINAVSGKTGITATMGASNGEIVLTSASGADIKISDYKAASANTKLGVAGLKSDGSFGEVKTIDNTDNKGAVVTGQVELSSAKSFAITTNEKSGKAGKNVLGEEAAGASKLASVSEIDLSSATGAADAIKVIDVALQKINQSRADLGAISNRLDSTISNLTNITVNIEGSRSQVMDADYAKESTALARSQILSQASTAMLAQANASKQNVLSLLQG